MIDLALTPEQTARQGEIRALLEAGAPPGALPVLAASKSGFDEPLFRRLLEGGWLAAERILDLALVFEELGRAALPGPFLTHVESMLTLRATGREAAFAGPATPGHQALAASEAWGVASAEAGSVDYERTDAGFTVAGTLRFVPFADSARQLLVAARARDDGTIALLVVDPSRSGIETTPLTQIGHERLFALRLDGVPLAPGDCVSEDAAAALEEASLRATILVCAELTGAAAAALDRAAAHARTREQFGRPIGAFQAVAHHCANMAIDVDAARLAMLEAASRCDAEDDWRAHARRAKVICSEAARRVTTTAHQVMAGEGFLAASGLHHFTRQVKALESRLGSPALHRARLADALGLPRTQVAD